MRIATRAPLLTRALSTLVVGAVLSTGAAGIGRADAAPQAPTGTEATAPAEQQRAAATDRLAAATDSGFYDTPDSLPTGNGKLVRQEKSVFYLDPVKLIRVPATATRIMYTSTDNGGRPIAVTGTVLQPTAPWRKPGKRAIVGYAAGTQGLADRCAPSRQLSVGSEYEGPGIGALLGEGYAVAITDYEGLGTENEHTYMIRRSQGQAVLDSVRAATSGAFDGLGADNPVALVGYSQGGGASIAAAELAGSYAPELNITAAVGGAVPADLLKAGESLDSGTYNAFLFYSFSGLAAAYGMDPTQVLNAEGMKVLQQARQSCTVDGLLTLGGKDSSTLTNSGKKLSSIGTDPAYAGLVEEQRLGDHAPKFPVMLSHSLADDVIPYAVGKELARSYCKQGADVEFQPMATPTHIGGYVASIPRTMAYLNGRMHGWPTLQNCWTVK